MRPRTDPVKPDGSVSVPQPLLTFRSAGLQAAVDAERLNEARHGSFFDKLLAREQDRRAGQYRAIRDKAHQAGWTKRANVNTGAPSDSVG
jgi:hypothetical protein